MRAGADWQAVWQRGGRRKCSRSYGRQPALIPVVRYNSRLMFITLPKAIIYTLDVAVENQPFHLPIYSYSYLFTIIPTDYYNTKKRNQSSKCYLQSSKLWKFCPKT